MTKKKFRVGNQVSFRWKKEIHSGRIEEKSYCKTYKMVGERFIEGIRIRKGYYTVKDSVDGELRVIHERDLWIEEKVTYT